VNGRTKIDRLRKAVYAGGKIPDDLRAWLLDGLRRWERSQESLEAALGIVRNREALSLRDAHLKRAVELMPRSSTKGERVQRIEAAARSLATFSDPQAVDWSNRPDWHEPLMFAMQAAPLPGRRRLYDLCSFPESCKKTRRQ